MNTQEQFRLSEEAALWLIRLRAKPGTQCREEFFDWVRQSPRHMEEFMFAKAVSKQFDGIDPGNKVGIDWEVLKGLGKEEAHLTLALSPTVGRRGEKTGRWIVGLAASVGIVLLGWMLFDAASDATRVYFTDIGDQQAVKLRDGSLVQLNTHSRMEVSFSEGARQVRLLEGEALFSVEHDPARPFRVYADGAVIQAIGTRFNVYRRPEGTRVSVVEGIVQISLPATEPVRLEAGIEADIAGGSIVKTAIPDIPRAVAWRARRLVFHSDRLEDVVREFNRYNRTPIRLDGAEVAQRRISGVFDADDTRPLIDFLNGRPGFSVHPAEDEIVIGSR